MTLGGLLIGECGTKGGPDPDGTVEIGYGLAAPWCGRGYGRELVAGLSAWLLDRHGAAHTIVAEVRADNLPSPWALELPASPCSGWSRRTSGTRCGDQGRHRRGAGHGGDEGPAGAET